MAGPRIKPGDDHAIHASSARGAFAFLADDTGSNAVEFALVLPLLVALLFGIFEFAQGLFIQGMLDYAVEQAARCASINGTTCGSASAIETYASQLTAPLNIPSGNFNASTPSCGNQVTASYVFALVGTMPLIGGQSLFPGSITLTASSCYPV